MDTGADKVLSRYSAVAQSECNIEPMDETVIIFGNRREITNNTSTHLGDLEVIVCNDDQLTDELIAIHPIVYVGYDIHSSSAGGTMDKPSVGHSVPIIRYGRKWLVDLEDLKNIKINQNPRCCYTTSIISHLLH